MMRKTALSSFVLVLLLFLGACQPEERQQIRIMGSSNVYPFASYVCEEFGIITPFRTPVIESTGSGGGIKIFSEGHGVNNPDIVNTSRRMKESEFRRSKEHGVDRIHEVILGYDGITLSQNIDSPDLDLTLEELTLAVAARVPRNGELVKNPYTHWNQINPDLPEREILIYGPPTTAGTRDAFEELVMEEATKKIPGYPAPYTAIREDGHYVPSGDNNNVIVQRLERDRTALGIFGYGFLDNNRDKVKPVLIEGSRPTVKNISRGDYPIARSLYFYVKLDNLDRVPGLEEYVDFFLSDSMIGYRGYLREIGLVPMPEDMREEQRQRWRQREVLQITDL